jgi:thiosulfate/3-mercaptopyruvate sulfurtransferase
MTLKTTLIDVQELAALLPGDVLIVDCRFELMAPGNGERDVAKGERDYREGHIPGAAYASLDKDLSDLSRQAEGLGRHPLPLASAFSAVLSRWGWHAGVQVVCYDAAGGSLAAARLWWLLRLAGIREVAVLDGGYPAWFAAGLPVESGEVTRAVLVGSRQIAGRAAAIAARCSCSAALSR